MPGPRGGAVTAGLQGVVAPQLGPGRGQEPGLRAGRAEHKVKILRPHSRAHVACLQRWHPKASQAACRGS